MIYNLHEAKASLSHLVDRVASGKEIILAKAGKPLANLVPFRPSGIPRQPGGWEGRMRIADDFDVPLPPKLQAVFEGRERARRADQTRPFQICGLRWRWRMATTVARSASRAK